VIFTSYLISHAGYFSQEGDDEENFKCIENLRRETTWKDFDEGRPVVFKSIY
jgi:hypothetical protein